MYDFDKNADEQTKAFVGFNTGKPMNTPVSSGMLNANTNILEAKCKEYDTSVPYFQKPVFSYLHFHFYRMEPNQ
jgi:hypothetical protein